MSEGNRPPEPQEGPLSKYSRFDLTRPMLLAYMLQFTKRSVSTMIHRAYLAEKISRANKASNEFELVCELDLENLRRYDECFAELTRP